MSPSMEEAAAQHVVRTLRALELFAEGPQTQADLANHLQIHRRTARRLIARLVAEGYLEPVEGGRRVSYAASPRLVVLGSRVAASLDLVAIGRRHLDAVDASLVQTRFLAVRRPNGVSVAFVENRDQPGKAISQEVQSELIPLHATAAGKVFLSADTNLLESVMHQELLSFTGETVVARADLLLELATVRARGYATENGEHRAGRRAVASGIIDHSGSMVAALGAEPAAGGDLDALGAQVRAAAAECSRAIGGLLTSQEFGQD